MCNITITISYIIMSQIVPQENAPTWFSPDYPPLKSSDDVGKAAMNEQVVAYPQVVRKMADPPISGQKYGNLSFMLFDTPRMFNNKPIYGYVKIRGNHESDRVAREDAYRIVRDVDSKYQVRIAEVGVWVPITEIDAVVKDLYDVRENDKEIHLRDQAIKEKEREAARIANELKEAEKKLENEGDIYDNPDSLRFYAMKRVTEMTLMETFKAQRAKMELMDKKIAEQRIILKRLENLHPEYKVDWFDEYNNERKKSGIAAFIPGEKQFDEYEAANLEDLLLAYGDHRPESIGLSSTPQREPEQPEETVHVEKTAVQRSSLISKKSTSGQ